MPVKEYRWGAEPQSCWDLREAFETFGYSFERDPATGDIVDISFEAEKLGDEIEFFRALAPVIEEDSFLEFGGDLHMRWVFRDGTLIEKSPRWEDDEDDD